MNTNISVVLLSLSKHRKPLTRLTLVGGRSHEAMLEEAMGLGLRLLKNEPEAVRVEIYVEHAEKDLSGHPLIVLTRDDIPQEEQKPHEHFSTWLSRFTRYFLPLQEIFSRRKSLLSERREAKQTQRL